ncbi:MAG: GerMN domain-containing protein [Deltaproteobacteria bacterium]|nr:GerMN domain-containing protein [Deltaproteobacteria bacterium]
MAGKKGKKNFSILVIAAVTLVAGIIVLAWLAGRPTEKQTRDINVFFSDEDGLYLKAEKRTIEKGELSTEAKEALEALVSGPSNAKLGKTLPTGTKLVALKIEGATAVVDLSPEVIKNHEGGSSGELQTIYSVVDTLSLNFPEIKDVQILVGGKKEETIAGHIDISQPLGPDKKIIKD